MKIHKVQASFNIDSYSVNFPSRDSLLTAPDKRLTKVSDEEEELDPEIPVKTDDTVRHIKIRVVADARLVFDKGDATKAIYGKRLAQGHLFNDEQLETDEQEDERLVTLALYEDHLFKQIRDFSDADDYESDDPDRAELSDLQPKYPKNTTSLAIKRYKGDI